MNRNVVIGTLAIIAIIIGVVLLQRNLRQKALTSGALAQSPTPSVAQTTITQTPITGRPRVTIKTSKGDIVIELRPDLAPKSVANYLQKFTTGFCEGKTFHRVEDWVVQGCDPLGNGMGGNTTLTTETSSEPFVVGSVGVARKSTPRELSNDSQFFIVKKDASNLNGEYTYLGKVVAGMDVVNKIVVGDKILSSVTQTK